MALPVVEIVWEDHYSTDAWRDKDDNDLEGNVFVSSVGYLLKETKTKIIIVQNNNTAGQISHTMTIMKKNIKSRVVVREG